MLRALLHPTVARTRAYSLITKHVKDRPSDLQLALVRGKDQRLIEFYEETVLREDPAVTSAAPTDPDELKSFLMACLHYQYTTVLRDQQSGQLVAAASGGPLTYTSAKDMRRYVAENMQHEGSRRLVSLWAAVTSESAVLDALHLPAAWDVSFIAVAAHMRGLGLAGFLVSQHKRLAVRLGYPALVVESFSPCLHSALIRAGLRSLPARPLSSFLDPSGRPWVQGAAESAGTTDVRVFYGYVHARKEFDTWLM